MTNKIQVWLIHPDEEMCRAFDKRFDSLPNVRVIQGWFEDLEPHDCFVTAGNAFGMMTAGIDAAVVKFFGETIMEAVQFRIMDEFLGEQPIGTAFLAGWNGCESWQVNGATLGEHLDIWKRRPAERRMWFRQQVQQQPNHSWDGQVTLWVY